MHLATKGMPHVKSNEHMLAIKLYINSTFALTLYSMDSDSPLPRSYNHNITDDHSLGAIEPYGFNRVSLHIPGHYALQPGDVHSSPMPPPSGMASMNSLPLCRRWWQVVTRFTVFVTCMMSRLPAAGLLATSSS